jgi:hypothetical protein
MRNLSATAADELTINIGEVPILVRTESPEFFALLRERYGSFAEIRGSGLGARGLGLQTRNSEALQENLPSRIPSPESRVPVLDVELIPSGVITEEPDVSVRYESRWVIERGDFRAEWDPATGRGWVRQTPNPYAIDSVLRILHSLVLAREGGFLVHAASAVRNGRAFLFSGVSGAGKTTISRLAPPDVRLLTDEISYVRKRGLGAGDWGLGAPGDTVQVTGASEDGSRVSGVGSGKASSRGFSLTPNPQPPVPSPQSPRYDAFGTPFAGELARLGEGVRAPVAALYFLAQGPENRVEPLSRTDAVRALLRNILFFAPDHELVQRVFDSVLDFVNRVPVRRLVFVPDARVWELIV